MLESFQVDPRIRKNPKEFLSLPKVIVVQNFDEEAAKSFRQSMNLAHRSKQPVIPILIESFGGDPYSLLSMVDSIRNARVPVATIVQGKAMSCGAVLFTCGSEGLRFMSPNSTLMIHDVGDEASTQSLKNAEIQANAKENGRLNRKLYRIMDKGCGKPKNFFWDLVQEKSRADWYLGAKEALKLNLCNHIKVPTLTTTISVDIKLEY